MVFWNRTKIVATIGPASSSKIELAAILKAGADVIRINGAHGNTDEHRKIITAVRELSRQKGLSTAILYDLPGPKMRLGTLRGESIYLKKGERVTLACGKTDQIDDRIPVCDRFIARVVKGDSRIFVNDGIVELQVIAVKGPDVECRVIHGGEIRSKKGINLPRARFDMPSLTARDRELLKFALGHDVDYIGLSFVRSAKNIADLRKLMKRRSSHVGIVAKIEKPEALDDIDAIIEASDAIMIARGDLGIEMPFEELPIIQKRLLRKCMLAGKPSITATQMLESMIHSASPTRAEAADVAMAVWEGTDAVMLSAETSIGENPSLAVAAMAEIASAAEGSMPDFGSPTRKSTKSEVRAQVISISAGIMADELGARAIVTPTRSGRTALFISNTRPRTLIAAPTGDMRIARRMALYWGVRPMMMPKFSTVDQMLRHAKKVALKSNLIKRGDTIVIVSGAHGEKYDITRLVEVMDL